MKATMVSGSGQQPLTASEAKKIGDSATATPFAWVDLRSSGPGDPDTEKMLIDLGVPQPGLKLAQRTLSSGVFTTWEGILIGTTWVMDDDGITPVAVHFAWVPQGFITVRWAGDKAMSVALEQATNRGQALFDKPTVVPGVVLQWMLASVTDAMTDLGEQVDDLDLAIIDGLAPGQLDQMRQLRTRANLVERRFPQYLEALRNGLVAPAVTGMDAAGWQEFHVYATGVQDVVAEISTVTDSLRNTLQDYQTQVGNKQGDRINQLTIVSIIFLPVTFLTGYFGMNFGWLDNRLNSFGSWAILGALVPVLMVVGSIALLARRGYIPARSRNKHQHKK